MGSCSTEEITMPRAAKRSMVSVSSCLTTGLARSGGRASRPFCTEQVYEPRRRLERGHRLAGPPDALYGNPMHTVAARYQCWSVLVGVARERRRESVAVQAPGQHSRRTDPDQLTGVAGPRRLRIGDCFGVTAELDAARRPRVRRRQIIDDECHSRLTLDVVEFLTASEAVATYVDRAESLVDEEADRTHLRRAVWPDRRQPPQGLAAEVVALIVAELHESNLPSHLPTAVPVEGHGRRHRQPQLPLTWAWPPQHSVLADGAQHDD